MTGTAISRQWRIALAAGTMAAFAAQAQAPATGAAAPRVYGHIERALVTGSPSIQIRAQLDGGGNTTVLYVTDIKYASGEGGMYVHFTIDNGQVMPGKAVNLSLPVVKDQLVHDRDGGVAHHPIVAMNFCIGAVAFSSNVILEPRTSFTPPLLLGKADAAQFAPIDPLKKDGGEPNCQAAPAAASAAAH
jgi:hypothetical protein